MERFRNTRSILKAETINCYIYKFYYYDAPLNYISFWLSMASGYVYKL